jgi:hypothetical protein
MARLERPLDPSSGPLQSFANDLRKVRAAAGNPTYRALARTAGYSATTLSEAARGERRPTLDVVLAYVGACRGDVEQWRRRWHALDDPPVVEQVQEQEHDVPEADAGPNVRRRVLIGAAAVLLAAVAGTVVAKWPGDRAAPPAAGAGCPQLPAKRAFTGETYGQGVPVRTGASTAAAVVATVPARCTLGFTGFCRGEKMRDATSGTPDVRWFVLADGNVVPSAMIHGNPPAQLRATACRDERPAPESVALVLSPDSAKPGAILARATGRNVDIVGFAARHADPGRSGSPQWQQIALSDGEFTGTWRPAGAASGTVTIVAVACLGGGGPTEVMDAKAVPGGATSLSPPDLTAAARSACQYPAGKPK